MRTWWLVLITLAAGTAGAGTVWKWVDENGVTHYSDRPVDGAEVIELGSVQTFPAQRPPSTPRSASSDTPTPATSYSRFEIVRPAQQETLWNVGGTVTVEVAIEPALAPGHRVDVYLDGNRLRLDSTTNVLQVPEVYRGVHSIQAAIFDQNGDEILRSLAVTFIVQQTSILNPNNPTPPARRN